MPIQSLGRISKKEFRLFPNSRHSGRVHMLYVIPVITLDTREETKTRYGRDQAVALHS